LQSPLPDGGGAISRLPQHGREGVIIGQGLVELVVAHRGVALVETAEKRSPRRSADRGGRIVVSQSGARRGELVERRGSHRRQRSRLLASGLEEGTEIAVAEVVRQNEEDVRAGRSRRLPVNHTRQRAGDQEHDGESEGERTEKLVVHGRGDGLTECGRQGLDAKPKRGHETRRIPVYAKPNWLTVFNHLQLCSWRIESGHLLEKLFLGTEWPICHRQSSPEPAARKRRLKDEFSALCRPTSPRGKRRTCKDL